MLASGEFSFGPDMLAFGEFSFELDIPYPFWFKFRGGFGAAGAMGGAAAWPRFLAAGFGSSRFSVALVGFRISAVFEFRRR